MKIKHIVACAASSATLVVAAVVTGFAQAPGVSFAQMALNIEANHGSLVGMELVRSGSGSSVYRAGVDVGGTIYTIFFDANTGVEMFRYSNGAEWVSGVNEQQAPVQTAPQAQQQVVPATQSPRQTSSPSPSFSPSSSSRPSSSPSSSPRR